MGYTRGGAAGAGGRGHCLIILFDRNIDHTLDHALEHTVSLSSVTCSRCHAQTEGHAQFCAACGSPVGDLASAALRPSPFTGHVVGGRYAIEEKLGEGGMGAVYRAQQLSLKRTVALKVLRPELSQSPGLVARFNAEAELAGKLNHPNTVTLYDFGQDIDGSLFIAMEYLEGKSLRDVLQREGALSPPRALHIADQVCASLADAHAHGIVHRDLKPDNVMLVQVGRRQDNVRVLDFGIAKVRDGGITTNPMTRAGDLLGTPQYMAPEQIRGEKVDQRTDVYALGVMLYEMVTGSFPFEGQTVMAIMTKHLTDTPQPPHLRRPDLGLPLGLSQLISRALEKDPALRPPSMDAFAEGLAGLGIATTSGMHTPLPGGQLATQPLGPGPMRSMPSSPPPGVPLLRPSGQGAVASPPPAAIANRASPPAGGAAPGSYGRTPGHHGVSAPSSSRGVAHVAPTAPGAPAKNGRARRAAIAALAVAALGVGAGGVLLVGGAKESDVEEDILATVPPRPATGTDTEVPTAPPSEVAEPASASSGTQGTQGLSTDFTVTPTRKIFADSSDTPSAGSTGDTLAQEDSAPADSQDSGTWPGGWYKAFNIELDVPAGFTITKAPTLVQFEGQCDGVPCTIRAVQAPTVANQDFTQLLPMLPEGPGRIGSPGRLRVSGQSCYSMIASAAESSQMVMCATNGTIIVLWVVVDDLTATKGFRQRFFARGVKL